MKSLIILSFFFLLISEGCIKEKVTHYTASLKNNTSSKILILPYKNGVVNSSDSIVLFSNSVKEIANGFFRGDVNTPSFSSSYFGGINDSILIVFDNTYYVTHYFNNPTNLSKNYYLSSSLRNVANPKSYQFERLKGKNDDYTNVHQYNFTEQDYLDAKK